MVYDPTLPADSTLGKSYEYGIDVSADGVTWHPVRRALNIVPAISPITQSGQSYDDKGAPNAMVAAWSAAPTFSAYVNRSTATGLLVPELRILDDAIGEVSDAAEVYARVYHKPADGSRPNPREAWQGRATVGITRGNIAPDGANELWNITLTGVGPWERVVNPFTGWSGPSVAPRIQSIGPAGRNAGDQVTVAGSGFVGVTAITLGGTAVAADLYTVVSPSTIVLTIPTGTATGARPLIVTNAGGASPAVNYTVV